MAKRIPVWLVILCVWLPVLICSEEKPSFLRDLEEYGYCVIPEVVSAAETEQLYQRMWREFIEMAWPQCKREERNNWKEAFPRFNLLGIFCGKAAQTQVMWDVRQDPRIVGVFAQIWQTDDLLVSLDGISLMCPPEIREGYFEPWPHVDQTVAMTAAGFVSESALDTHPFTIQGQFLFETSGEDDGGFYCIPKSHRLFAAFAPELERIEALEGEKEEKKRQKEQLFYAVLRDETGQLLAPKHVTAPRGSLILWDSRTLHWNQHPSPTRKEPRVRMVGYVSYVPKARLKDGILALRKRALEGGASTGHDPITTELKWSHERVKGEFLQYLEDPSYVVPEIHLTPLGRSLLGLD